MQKLVDRAVDVTATPTDFARIRLDTAIMPIGCGVDFRHGKTHGLHFDPPAPKVEDFAEKPPFRRAFFHLQVFFQLFGDETTATRSHNGPPSALPGTDSRR